VTNGLDFEIYRNFMKHVLEYEAMRVNQFGKRLLRGQRRYEMVAGEKRRVPLRGRHIEYSGVERFRGSDSLLRQTLAVRAGEIYHKAKTGKERGANWNACQMVAELQIQRGRAPEARRGPKRKPTPATAPARPANYRSKPREIEGRDPRFAELDAAMAEEETRKCAVAKRRREVDRVARSIKKAVDAFRARQKGWDLDAMFRGWFSAYRFDHHRDAEWYAEQEVIYRARVEQVEDFLGPAEGRTRPEPPRGISPAMWERTKAYGMCTRQSDLARAIVVLAHLYHEQRKYRQAIAEYNRALAIYTSAAMPEPLREVSLCWIPAQIANCEAAKAPDPFPAIRPSSL
jgi:hypothetical protein